MTRVMGCSETGRTHIWPERVRRTGRQDRQPIGASAPLVWFRSRWSLVSVKKLTIMEVRVTAGHRQDTTRSCSWGKRPRNPETRLNGQLRTFESRAGLNCRSHPTHGQQDRLQTCPTTLLATKRGRHLPTAKLAGRHFARALDLPDGV